MDPSTLRAGSGPQSRIQRLISRALTRSLALLSLIGITFSATAAAVHEAPSAASNLESRVQAVRNALDKQQRAPYEETLDGKRTFQWGNWPNWNNWNNWPNWPNWGNWNNY